ncbi:hypothetical protein CARUB_v10022484mg [Capsella rubella]|uniref:Uncharacterized protein n=2 Tax=Capsella rubella TaxID=81985 RepID=R0IDX9_9BRAS|nr:hypothetical protein CARUB_v10022484mg [Capsella rubella]
MLRLLMGEMLWKCYEDDKKEGEADCEGDDDDNNSCHSEAMWEINDQRRQFSDEGDDDDDDAATMLRTDKPSFFRLFKFIEDRRTEEIADPEMLEKMSDISEEEVSQMKAFKMLSLRCVGHKGEIPTMVEVAKELKKIQKISSSPIGETTQFNSP